MRCTVVVALLDSIKDHGGSYRVSVHQLTWPAWVHPFGDWFLVPSFRSQTEGVLSLGPLQPLPYERLPPVFHVTPYKEYVVFTRPKVSSPVMLDGVGINPMSR